MKITLAGNTGYIGSALSKHLTQVGHSVHNLGKNRIHFKDSNVVINAAGIRGIKNTEENILQCIESNVSYTMDILKKAKESALITDVIGLSSDKSYQLNTYGCSKLLVEKLYIHYSKTDFTTNYKCIRIGNVINSPGSVIPSWREEAKRCGTLTISTPSPLAFCTINDVATWVEQSLTLDKTLIVPEHKVCYLEDLAKAVITKYNLRAKLDFMFEAPETKYGSLSTFFTEEELLQIV